jgi:hypothetical protein
LPEQHLVLHSWFTNHFLVVAFCEGWALNVVGGLELEIDSNRFLVGNFS